MYKKFGRCEDNIRTDLGETGWETSLNSSVSGQ
jgi:hypothetical protein